MVMEHQEKKDERESENEKDIFAFVDEMFTLEVSFIRAFINWNKYEHVYICMINRNVR